VLVVSFLPKPVAVETVTVTRGPLTVSVLQEGKTRIRHRYVISPPVSGYLNRVTLRAGAAIHAGKTVLATIQAEASGFLDGRTRAEAQARVKAAEAIRMQRETDVGRARAALDLARKELARADTLYRQGGISRQSWDDVDTRVKLLSQELRSAEFGFHAAEFGVEQARATVQQVSFSGANGSAPLQIVAPVDGVVLDVYEENARVVAVGTPIMEIGDPRDLEAEIELLSSDAVAVLPGAEVFIEQWGGGTPMRGRVSLVEPGGFTKISALGVEEQRVRAHIDFLDPPASGQRLGDRYRVEARVVTWQGDNVLQVPTGVLFRRGSNWMAFVVEDGRAHLRKVEIAHNNGVAAEVLSGLVQGNSVIVYPPDSIEEGTAVSGNSKK
jgi:HlyD family secretion protein